MRLSRPIPQRLRVLITYDDPYSTVRPPWYSRADLEVHDMEAIHHIDFPEGVIDARIQDDPYSKRVLITYRVVVERIMTVSEEALKDRGVRPVQAALHNDVHAIRQAVEAIQQEPIEYVFEASL